MADSVRTLNDGATSRSRSQFASGYACDDLRKLDDAGTAALRAASLRHQVIYIRGQSLSDEDLVALGRRFGELQLSNPLGSPLAIEGKAVQGGRIEEHPEVTVVSNIVRDGVAIGGLGDGEVFWHTDMSSFEQPPAQTMLYAIEVPEAGGQTSFADMYRAYETLPASLSERVAGRLLKHDNTIDAAGHVRKGMERHADEDVSVSPGRAHPLVRTHPETGRPCLYLGRRSRSYIVGLGRDDSEALLDELWAHATQPQLTWSHEWRAGDVLIWDNRCVMHRREPFDPHARRLLHRVVVRGTKPMYIAPAVEGARAKSDPLRSSRA